MRSGIVVYQEKPRTYCISVGPNNRPKDFVSVPCTCQITTIKHMQVFLGNASPDHYWPTTEPVVQDDVACLIMFPCVFPNPYVSLNLNWLSSVKRTGCQWQIRQYWCSMANALWAARWWGVRIKPTNGHRDLNSLLWSRFLTVWSEICSPVPRCKSLSRDLAVLCLNLLADKTRYLPCWRVVALLCPCPARYPRVLANLSKSPPSTRDNTCGYPEPSCDQTHRWTLLEQLDGLGNFTRLWISHDVTVEPMGPNAKGKRWISNVYWQ